MIHAVITGNLGADPELKYLPAGEAVLELRVAASSRQKVGGEWQEVTTWCRVAMFGKRGESLSKLLAKGERVCVRGALTVREFAKNDGTKGYSVDVRADEIELMGSKRDGAQPQSAQRPAQAQPTSRYGQSGAGNAAKHSAPVDDYPADDIPFARAMTCADWTRP